MARTAIVTILAVVAITSSSGCGTCINCVCPVQNGGGRVYGGTATDAVLVGKTVAHGLGFKEEEEKDSFYAVPVHWTRSQAFLWALFLTADIPLSAVADTLTLPITIPVTVERWDLNEWVDRRNRVSPKTGRPVSPAGADGSSGDTPSTGRVVQERTGAKRKQDGASEKSCAEPP
jgi:uncharacterized protein YceK